MSQQAATDSPPTFLDDTTCRNTPLKLGLAFEAQRSGRVPQPGAHQLPRSPVWRPWQGPEAMGSHPAKSLRRVGSLVSWGRRAAAMPEGRGGGGLGGTSRLNKPEDGRSQWGAVYASMSF